MRTAALLCIVLATAAPAHAADEAAPVELPPSEVEVEGGEDTALAPAASTVFGPDELRVPAKTLADVVAAAPGVQIRRAGAANAFAALSIRGLTGANVGVVLDDVPLTSSTFGPVSLTLYPAAGIERVEVYRGAAPLRFESPLGGVVRLVSRLPRDRLDIAVDSAYGAWQTRSAHASIAGPLGPLRCAFFAGYEGTSGGFRFHDDASTPYNPADDTTARRTNNASDAARLSLAADADGPAAGTISLRASGRWLDQGVPGPLGMHPTIPAASGAAHAREGEGTGRVALRDAALWDGRLIASGGLDLLFGERAFRDPAGETGLGIGFLDSTLWRTGADGRLRFAWSASSESELAPRLGYDRFRQRGTTAVVRDRAELGAGFEHRLDLGALRLAPSVRGEIARDHAPGAQKARVAAASPRVGVIYFGPAPCELRANAGRFHRFPTPLERFGDGVSVAPNPDLRPERGLSADVGGACRVTAGRVRARGELALYGTKAEQLIALVQNAQRSVRPENLGDARILGLESALRLESPWAELDLAYSLTDARDRSGLLGFDGHVTPGMARHRLTGALEVGWGALHLRYELTAASLFYLDRANNQTAPSRAIHDLRARAAVLDTGFDVELAVTNLTDVTAQSVPLPGRPGATGVATVTEFTGYPLPGRGWLFTVVWRSR